MTVEEPIRSDGERAIKVAFVYPHSNIPAPPSDLGDALALVNYELSRRLARKFDTTVYCGRGRGQPRMSRHEGVQFRRIEVLPDKVVGQLKRLDGIAWRDPRKPFRTSRLYYPMFAHRVARDLRRERCDIVHVHAIPNLLPVIRRANPGAKLVFHAHDHLVSDFDRSRMLGYLRHADLVLGCSRFVAESIRRRFPEVATRCDYLHNGVDLLRFSAPDRWCRSRSGGSRLLFVGRLSPEKGVDLLLRAFARVLPTHPSTTLELVGPDVLSPGQFVDPFGRDPVLRDAQRYYRQPGLYGAELRRIVAGGLQDNVTFAGRVANSELALHYAAADVFVFPSQWHEPFGMPLPEAMAAGLPVVATDGGAFPEIVESGSTGLLVPRGDEKALADAMSTFVERPDLRLSYGRAGLERARMHFSWDAMTDRLAGLYQRLMEAA